jgi:2-(1,2-epoxy-1,2-dihydrophenyl)acetyl-CoA isomerase
MSADTTRMSMAGAPDPILVADDAAVRVITLNRPERRNAIDLPLRYALAAAIESAMTEESVRAVVLTGAGGAFCSGGDISTMRRQAPAETRPRAEAAQRVIRAIWTGSKPVIAAVEGPAFGAGTALAIACDRVIAAADAVFGTTFTGVGLAGDMGIFASLPARVGVATARQLLMLPRKVAGTEAIELGLADAICPSGEALAHALSDARRLSDGPPLALAAIKAQLGEWPKDRLQDLDDEVEHQVRLWDSADFAEGVAAFAERRPPRFSGV